MGGKFLDTAFSSCIENAVEVKCPYVEFCAPGRFSNGIVEIITLYRKNLFFVV